MLAFLSLLQQNPEAHYGGGAASGAAAGATTEPTGQLFRFLLTTVPQWVQIAGIFIGGPIALIVAWQVWKHRTGIWDWFTTRSRLYKLGIVATFGFVLLIGGFVGVYNYNYVMHKNDFCQSCHLMDAAWDRFQATAHKDLQCHACHRQPLIASSKELFYWVFERRMAIPAHDKVPTAVCSECHVRLSTDSSRTNITLTAGHVIHLKSDSAALKNVQCVTCHGRDFHMFRPNNATCSQAGCHAGKQVKLGAMASARFLHCTTCHDFRTRVPGGENVTDAKRAVAPKSLGCTACHAMAEKVLRWDLAADPHNGSCGSCHNPHKQEQPAEAFKSCATGQCHASADTLTAFHRGLGAHKLDQCGACHQAHSWKVKGTDCQACHTKVWQDKPLAEPRSKRMGGGPPDSAEFVASLPPQGTATATATAIATQGGTSARATGDSTFLHSKHRGITCTSCHATTGTHGKLTVSTVRDCRGCHHGAKQAATCTSCHATGTIAPRAKPMPFAVVARKPATTVTRPVTFAHARHAKVECTRCHGTDVDRTVRVTCAECHADHHTPDRECATCHVTAKAGHDRAAHDGCTSCHAPTPVPALTSGRQLCLACHQEQRNHYPTGACTTCHLVPREADARRAAPGSAR